jgi:Domain of unknown function (DUF4129)
MNPGWRLPVPARSGPAMRAIAARIVAERQFKHDEDLWQRFVEWVEAHLNVQVPALFGAVWATFVVLAVLVGAVAAIIYLAIKNGPLRRGRLATKRGVVVTDEDRPRSADDWRREADRLAARGDYREAMRCRYRALVAELADRRLIDQVPGRTSGDYERAVRALVPEVAEQFSSATRLFERCWYGQETSDARAQVVFDDAAGAVIDAVGSGRWKALAKEAGRSEGELVGLK